MMHRLVATCPNGMAYTAEAATAREINARAAAMAEFAAHHKLGTMHLAIHMASGETRTARLVQGVWVR